ncbi:DUF5694 domain-containing protein [Flavobacterium quisquiliarum]|uniref:DUF5694 domain-containing protein n=1 Tax=Flavobacterium quisquiliarum TaxID=1834436 RepID=A0ABV8W7M6_9FLAO|nr:DUF5694 domain-containing protein [Flavobacterium quisquiliarum]MBW1656615.1 hypothetical protein [Flavobacterium quisquiliarum]NWL03716.1 hypothetical protein [Flavobacterium collinsii]
MQKIILLLAIITLNLTSAQTKKKQILLIGTFHYANPGLDVAQVKSFDILSEKSQKELEIMTDKIKKFGPDKIFVEWEFSKQADLNKFYNKNTDSLFKTNKSEITQLALRTAKKLNHKKLYGMNLYTSFPYDSLMMAMEKANQKDLMKRNNESTKKFEKDHNEKIAKSSLQEMMLYYNTKQAENENLQWYLEIANRAGNPDDFSGPSLVSNWYKRNLYMYSLIQKLTESTDNKIMILVGAGHAAIIRGFIEHDPTFQIVDLATVLK